MGRNPLGILGVIGCLILIQALPALAGSRIDRVLPEPISAGVSFVVTNIVSPGEEVLVYLVEETVPPDWAVSSINERGFVDIEQGKIKWGPFFDKQRRELTYRLTPPASARGEFLLRGQGSFNGDSLSIQGASQIQIQPPQGEGGENSVASLLPAAFLPGGMIVLTNQVRLAEATVVYMVEDSVPAGWTVGVINHGGQFDPVTRRVKWGPFSDRVERDLWCELKPPADAADLAFFAGFASFDGRPVLISGQRESRRITSTVIAELPAQFQADEQITVSLSVVPAPNTTVFLVEERIPAGWTLKEVGADGTFDLQRRTIKWGPLFSTAPLRLSYRIQAPAVLDSDFANFSGTGSFDGRAVPISGRREIGALTSKAIRILPAEFLGSFSVTNHIIPDPRIQVYAVEDVVPTSWTASEISDDGIFDPVTRKIKWGPLLDGKERKLRYTLTPPLSGAKTARFNGVAAFDGRSVTIAGLQETTAVPATRLHKIQRTMPASVRAGRSIMVTNQVVTGPGVSVQSFEDRLPAGWKATQINLQGAFDAVNSKVKWGPFLDGDSRVLIYELVPPQSANGLVALDGLGAFNEDPVPITGASALLAIANFSPLARDDLFQRIVGEPLVFNAGDLLANDNDPNGDSLSLAEIDLITERKGTIQIVNDVITYRAPAGPDEGDSFNYIVEDGYGGRAKGRVQVMVITAAPSQNRVTLEQLPNAAVRVRFVGIPGRRYRVQATESLDPPNWITLGSVVASIRGDLDFEDTDAANHRSRFYRTIWP